MRILVVHNHYQQGGGEDSVVRAETGLLSAAGHDVFQFKVSNDVISNAARTIASAVLATFNPFTREQLIRIIRDCRPDVVHVHNFFPLISPSVFSACRREGVPVVWTMHNFRIACASGTLFRNGAPCEKCLGASPIHGVIHKCYRNSFSGSLAVCSMIGYHSSAGTWSTQVDRFIALTEFSRSRIRAAGVPDGRIVVKPNFVFDPGPTQDQRREGAVFVGRLSTEKGLLSLIDSWRGVQNRLTLVGDGPQLAALQSIAPDNVTFLGHQSPDQVRAIVSKAQMLVVPSIWYENFPMVIAEAMALGTPVVASRIGALSEIVIDGENGLHFTAGDAQDLRRTVNNSFERPETLLALGAGARKHYESFMSPEPNLAKLLDIYNQVINCRPKSVS